MNSSNKRGRFKLGDLPPLTDAQREELARLASRPDDDIDTTDIRELPPESWATASRGLYYKPTKSSVTTRIDNDVLAWLKSQGGAYQSRMNAILRHVMLNREAIAPHKVFQVDRDVDPASARLLAELLLGKAAARKIHVLEVPDDASRGSDLLERMGREFQSATL